MWLTHSGDCLHIRDLPISLELGRFDTSHASEEDVREMGTGD
jgi:hypothetical protein